jgi:integrase
MLLYRVARGFKEGKHLLNLVRFDRFCAEKYPQAEMLTSKIVYAWLDAETKENAWVLPDRATTVRQFGMYLNTVDEETYILPEKFATNRSAFTPFILTDSELALLFTEIDKLQSRKDAPFFNIIAPVLFRLIYTCGLRPNEGRELRHENVDLVTGEILITHTKRNKERIVVMSDDMLTFCRSYDMRRGIFGSGSHWFFPSHNGGALTAQKIYKILNTAWFKVACSPQNPVPRPLRVYDLRHRFASACLNRWLDHGENLMAMLPYLRTFMGHGSMNETAYYIHLLPENLVKSAGIDWAKLNSLIPEVDVCRS